MEALGIVVVIVVVVLIALLGSSVRVLREYERGVVFRLGRLVTLKDPGLVLLIPVIDRMVRVGMRTVTLNVPAQDVITRDNVPVRVNAVTYFRVVDANRSIVEVENFLAATSQIAQTSLRAVLGKAELDTLLSERERLNADLQKVIDQQTEPWGIKVLIVEIKDVEIPGSMQRAIARQAEAERERRAKVINAEGEFQASAKLAEAADVMSTNPATLQLRYLQTLLEIGSNNSNSVVIPLPIDLLQGVLGSLKPAADASDKVAEAKRAADAILAESRVAGDAQPEMDAVVIPS
ncbi:slipin family protein [Allobranchiibius sp. GilTou73]|uniref:slipin family protein n=1 Tax=Allobranchiibius sp. GilTou73 TaxID=2904523 RepID=UPI001F480FB4|nr:slipin family protein [Allobranchiibius sp. GilTou73]UIJ33997.1 slipin family protein [Allobranchiibius sp. GilTou73]